jgi:hypothetical protein
MLRSQGFLQRIADAEIPFGKRYSAFALNGKPFAASSGTSEARHQVSIREYVTTNPPWRSTCSSWVRSSSPRLSQPGGLPSLVLGEKTWVGDENVLGCGHS